MNNENERIEYKREFVDDIAKEVIAFANTDGGEIYEIGRASCRERV